MALTVIDKIPLQPVGEERWDLLVVFEFEDKCYEMHLNHQADDLPLFRLNQAFQEWGKDEIEAGLKFGPIREVTIPQLQVA